MLDYIQFCSYVNDVQIIVLQFQYEMSQCFVLQNMSIITVIPTSCATHLFSLSVNLFVIVLRNRLVCRISPI